MKTRPVFFPFLILASIGLLTSVADHMRALAGKTSLFGEADALIMFFGTFVVFVPATVVQRRKHTGIPYIQRFRFSFRGRLNWANIALTALGIYGLVTLFVVVVSNPGAVTHGPGPLSPRELRYYSAFAVFVYGSSIESLYPVVLSGQLNRAIRCPDGHSLSAQATLCPYCGKLVVPDASVTE